MAKKLTGVPGVPINAAVGTYSKKDNDGKEKIEIRKQTDKQKIADLEYALKDLRQDFHHLRERFENWQELRGADLDIYKTIKKKVYEDSELLFLIKMFLSEEMSFNPRRQYLKTTGRKEHHVKQD